MADITVQINTPALSGGEKFKVRYRLLPSGSFSAYTDRTNAPFTLTGLSVGEYEFEIIFVRADGQECPSVLKYYSVFPDYECIDFTSEMIREEDTGLFYIVITYIPPPTSPPCGWRVIYSTLASGGSSNVIPYASLPTGGSIRIPVSNVDYNISIVADLCGRSIECYNQDIESIEEPCTGIVITESSITQNPPPSTAYNVNFTFTQSTPPTRTMRIIFQQTGVPIVAGTPLDSQSITFPYPIGGPGQTGNQISRSARPTPTFGQITYNVTVIDDCEERHDFTVTFG